MEVTVIDSQDENGKDRNIDNEVNEFCYQVNIEGVGHLYGLAKGDNESDEDFKKRIRSKIESRPKTKEEHNNELFALLKEHFMDRLCWWSVSNGGEDFEIEMTENNKPMSPCITLKIYPSGKPLITEYSMRDFGIIGGNGDK
jgi:hypothetical protein